ncbi:ankyrin repeat domain-containing protein [Paraburkholderia humisilvae]|uniref:Novel STAND NTPase 1 domain-containing protein n=1 Tax=Paraburkholderia humisilvae TaxID=627669 RepID=A0A6J5EXJ3_9BURK|nr:ankyrin repeat domain-containing protein [Paraburkholderia humisilvae]CAB3770131.1 hypothetical protein LMG29542_06272 [Paraburkholderia humisilvae]
MLHKVKLIKVFIGGPTDARSDQKRLYSLFAPKGPLLNQFHGECHIEAQYWDSPDGKVPPDSSGNIQPGIESQPVNPGNCDVLLMYFKIKRGTRMLQQDFASSSFREIEMAFERPTPPPKAFFIWEKFDDYSLEDCTPETRRRLEKEQKVVEQAHKKLQSFLKSLGEKNGKTLGITRVDRKQADNLQNTVYAWLFKTFNELLEDSPPPPPPPLPPDPMAEFEGYPYPGLRELTVTEGSLFFGHTKQRDAMLDSLRADDELRLIYIHGPSGVGKSSLLQAGMLHHILRKRALEDRPLWAWALFKPSENRADPFTGLVESCLTHANARLLVNRDALADTLRNASIQGIEQARDALTEHLLNRLPKGGSGLIIAVNQFEEIWSTASAWREPFLNLIAAAESTPRVIVLATLRSDLLGAFTTAPQITPILQKRKPFGFALGAPSRDDLIEMITEPARIANIKLDPTLAGTIAQQAQEFKDAALPIVAAMMQKLRLPDDGSTPRMEIGYREFDAAGPLSGIIAKLVERVSATYNQSLLHRLFGQLTGFRDGRFVSVAVPRSALVGNDCEMDGLIAHLSSEARVLHVSGIEDAVVRLAHDTLFDLWPALKTWQTNNLADYAVRDDLLREAQMWSDRGRIDREIRLRPERLQEIEDLRAERPDLFRRQLDREQLILLNEYISACDEVGQQERLVQAIRGGQLKEIYFCLKRLKKLRSIKGSILDQRYRGNENGTDPDQLTPAFWAAVTGDSNDLSGEHGPRYINQTVSRLVTPLFVAAIGGHPQLVRTLVEMGANPLGRDEDQCTVVHAAALGGNLEVARFLIEECHADPVAVNWQGTPALVWAIQQNHADIIEYLNRWQPIDFELPEGWNTLTEAARAGNCTLVIKLIKERGIPVNHRTKDGYTALQIACGSEDVDTDEVVRCLLDNGALASPATHAGETALHFAALVGKVDAISLLAASVADPVGRQALLDAQDQKGRVALHWACYSRRARVVRKLLELGASPDLLDRFGLAPIDYAVLNSDWRSAKALVEEGAHVDLSADGTSSALHRAVGRGDSRMVELLLNEPATNLVNREARDGVTPLGIAAEYGYAKIVLLLLKAGADLEMESAGADVLELAMLHENKYVQDVLKAWIDEHPSLAKLKTRQKELERKYSMRALARLLSLRGDSVGRAPDVRHPIPDAPLLSPPTVDEVRTQFAKGVDEKEATLCLKAATFGGRPEIVAEILNQAKGLLRPADLSEGAELAVRHGHGPVATCLVDAGAELPWWWRRVKLSERAQFLSFSAAGAPDLKLVADAFRTAPDGSFAGNPSGWTVRSASLSFLPGHRLLAIECLDSRGQNEQFMVVGPDGASVLLDWTSNAIATALARLADTESALESYIRFFLHFCIRGDAGRFQIVTSVDQIPWRSDVTEDEKLRAARHLKPVLIRRRHPDYAHAYCSLLYEDTLYITLIRIAIKVAPVSDGTTNAAPEPVYVGQTQMISTRPVLSEMHVEVDGAVGIFG